MNCRELIEGLDAYVEERLAPEERAAFEAHIAHCPYCDDYLASYRATLRWTGRAFLDPDADVPADVPEELVRAVVSLRRPRESGPSGPGRK